MKKKIVLLAALLMLISGVVSASSLNGDYKGNPIVKLKSNGTLIDSGEVPAMIYDDKTMVPIAALRNLGANVIWNQNDYSVDMTINPSSQADNELIKKRIRALDLYVYLQDSAKYIQGFKGIMDDFYYIANTKGFFKNDEDLLYSEYTKTNQKVQESINKSNSIYLDLIPSEVNDIKKNLSDIGDMYKLLEDSYVNLSAWKMAKFENGYGSDIYDQSYNLYLQNTKKSQDLTIQILNNLKYGYTNELNNSLQ